jgi:hypothetical protein
MWKPQKLLVVGSLLLASVVAVVSQIFDTPPFWHWPSWAQAVAAAIAAAIVGACAGYCWTEERYQQLYRQTEMRYRALDKRLRVLEAKGSVKSLGGEPSVWPPVPGTSVKVSSS